MNKNNRLWYGLAMLLLVAISCKKEEDTGTKAVFSYVADGFKVNFTNFSTNATSYEWDFGDGNTSTQRSPMHIFRAKGDFLVTLRASGGQAESTFVDTVVILGPNIRIDGDFSDWDYVPYALENETGGGNILAAKTFASSDNLYFYIEGTEQFSLAVLDLYIDADNNPATGFHTWMYPAASGADFLLEGNFDNANPLASVGNIFRHLGPGNGWGWQDIGTFGDVLQFSQIKTVSGKKVIEFSVKRSLLGTTRNYINFALIEMDAGWSPVGSFPLSQQATSGFLPVPL